MKQRFLIILGGGVFTLMLILVGLATHKSSDNYAGIRWNDTVLASPFGISGNIGGYIWSSNIGWTKLFGNPNNYGLNLTFTENTLAGTGPEGPQIITGGTFTGRYAWNSNVGWIDFNPTVSDPSEYPSIPRHGVVYTAGNGIDSPGRLVGWARALSHTGSDGWDGWIKFGGPQYAVNRIGCEFQGYAWGGSTVGWIKTNGANYRMGLNPDLVGCRIPDIGSITSNPGPVITRSNAQLSWNTSPSVSSSDLLGYRTTTPWLIDQGADPSEWSRDWYDEFGASNIDLVPQGDGRTFVYLRSNRLLPSQPNQIINPPNLFGGFAEYGLQTINRFGDAGEAFSENIQIRYELEVSCEIQPRTTDTTSPVRITATGINGVNTDQDGPTSQYTFILSTTTDDTITASQPLETTTTEDSTTWENVLLSDAEIGAVVYQIEVRDDAYPTDPTRTATVQCNSVTNFGDRQFEEVSS